MSTDGTGFYLYGIVRAGSWRGWRRTGGDGEDTQRVRSGDLEALVRPVPFTLPPFDPDLVTQHQRTVENAMRRGTVLPAPYGVVFRGRRPLIRFLQDQYLVLDEALAFIEGHWELRLHIAPAEADPEIALGDLAMQLYAELRRFARAAVPFRREAPNLLSAAFLVDRGAWIDFIERTHDLAGMHPELSCDVTGPWPPYDFIKMAV